MCSYLQEERNAGHAAGLKEGEARGEKKGHAAGLKEGRLAAMLEQIQTMIKSGKTRSNCRILRI